MFHAFHKCIRYKFPQKNGQKNNPEKDLLHTNSLNATVVSICGSTGMAMPIWWRSLSKWPALQHSLQLHQPPMIITGAHLHNRGVTVFIRPNTDRDIDLALSERVPWLGYMMEPVTQPGWDGTAGNTYFGGWWHPCGSLQSCPFPVWRPRSNLCSGHQQIHLDHGHGPGHCLWASWRIVRLLPQWPSYE